MKRFEIGAALAVGALGALAGCAARRPVIADVRCPHGTTMVLAKPNDGRCVLPDGKRHGPSFSASASGVSVEGWDHGVRAGPYARWDASGALVDHGYRPGVTDSTEAASAVSSARWDSPKQNGVLVWPARVRPFPVQTDATFAAETLVSSAGRPTSSFVGAALDVALTPRELVRHRGDAYQAWFLAYGAQGLAGAIARAECDDPAIAGSGGFCGSRWMAGPFVRIGYFRSHDARPNGSLPSMLAYGRLGFLIGQDRWSSTYSKDSALVWRFRAGAGYTAFGAVADLVRHALASPMEGWRWLLVPIAALLEHAEGYVELGGDGGSGLGIGAGVDVGFGL